MTGSDDKPPKLVRGPRFLRNFCNNLAKAVWENRVFVPPSVGSMRQTDKGRFLNVFLPPDPPLKPFQVYVSSYTSGVVKCKVAKGYMFTKSRWTSGTSPSGLDTEFTVISGDKIWMRLAVGTDLALGAVSIGHGVPSTNGWTAYPDAVQYNDIDDPDRYQQYWFQLLAYIIPYAANPPRQPAVTVPFSGNPGLLIQCTETNLRACQVCDHQGGSEIIELQPWHSPFVS